MPRKKFVSRVLWPSDLLQSPSGYLVGWNVREFVSCVAMIIPHTRAGLADVEQALESLTNDATWGDLRLYCDGSPVVLGTWTAERSIASGASQPTLSGAEAALVAEKRHSASIWLSMRAANRTQALGLSTAPVTGSPANPKGTARTVAMADVEGFSGSTIPSLRSLYCCGCPYPTSSHIIFYNPPTKLHYVSAVSRNPWFNHSYMPSTKNETDFDVTLHQVNTAFQFRLLVEQRLDFIAAAKAKSLNVQVVSSAEALAKAQENAARERASSAMSSASLSASGVGTEESKGDAASRTAMNLLSKDQQRALRPRGRTESSATSGTLDEDSDSSLSDFTDPSGSDTESEDSAASPGAGSDLDGDAGEASSQGEVGHVDSEGAHDDGEAIRGDGDLALERGGLTAAGTRHRRRTSSSRSRGSSTASMGSVASALAQADTAATHVMLTPPAECYAFSDGSSEESAGVAGMVARVPRQLLWLLWCTIAAGLRSCVWLLGLQVPAWIPRFGGHPVRAQLWTLRQLDHRVRLILSWQRRAHARRNCGWQRAEDLVAYDAQLWGGMWLVAFDVGLGVLVGGYLMCHKPALEATVQAMYDFGQILHVDVLRDRIEWLMWVPAGFKLNENLDTALGSMMLCCIDAWEAITTMLGQLDASSLSRVPLLGFLGITFLLAFVFDVLNLLTSHIYLMYSFFSRLHQLQIGMMSSLFHLFRGKKRNVLRGRVDSAAFDISQLLIGTLLFTVIFFLTPTSMVFYIFFSMVWLVVLMVQALLWWSLAILNHFPFYLIGTYITDRGKLPGGVRMVVLSSQEQVQVPLPLPEPAAAKATRHSSAGTSDSSPDDDLITPWPSRTASAVLPGHRRTGSGGARGIGSRRQVSTGSLPQLLRAGSGFSGRKLLHLSDSSDSDANSEPRKVLTQASPRSLEPPGELLSGLSLSSSQGGNSEPVAMAAQPYTVYVMLHAVPTTVPVLFWDIITLIDKLWGHYSPAKLIGSLANGKYIPPSRADFAALTSHCITLHRGSRATWSRVKVSRARAVETARRAAAAAWSTVVNMSGGIFPGQPAAQQGFRQRG